MSTAMAPWLDVTAAGLLQSLDQGRLAHAFLLQGAAGLGKRALARHLVAALLCESRVAGAAACGQCRGCTLLAAGTHPDSYAVGLAANLRGGERTEIVIDQIRDLCARLAQTSHRGGRRVACIDPADALNRNAANALLKTLEEPPPGVVLMLVADQSSRLLPTLRSRCRILEVRQPTAAEACSWLASQGINPEASAAALELAAGNPGEALLLAQNDPIRKQVLADLTGLRGGRPQSGEVARRWSGDDRALRLGLAAQMLRRAMLAKASSGDAPGAQDLTAGMSMAQLSDRFDAIGRLRALASAPLRHELLLLDWLMGWADAGGRQIGRPSGIKA